MFTNLFIIIICTQQRAVVYYAPKYCDLDTSTLVFSNCHVMVHLGVPYSQWNHKMGSMGNRIRRGHKLLELKRIRIYKQSFWAKGDGKINSKLRSFLVSKDGTSKPMFSYSVFEKVIVITNVLAPPLTSKLHKVTIPRRLLCECINNSRFTTNWWMNDFYLWYHKCYDKRLRHVAIVCMDSLWLDPELYIWYSFGLYLFPERYWASVQHLIT